MNAENNGFEADTKDPVIATLMQQTQAVREEQEELQERLREATEQFRVRLQEVTDRLVRYEKALKVLTGEPLRQNRPSAKHNVPKRDNKTRLAPERLEAIEKVIREIAEQQDEFRQVDVRSRLDINSSVCSSAFAVLRENGVIRMSRVDGNNKYFRMTREALNATT